MNSSAEYRKICNDLAYAIKEAFSADFIAYAYLSGTFAYGGGIKGKSDLDVTIVFIDKAYRANQNLIQEQIKLFIKKYRQIHVRYGYMSDDVFPGEYITLSQVEDAIRGRGFSVDENSRIYLPEASNEYYLASREHWFRAWLSSSAFSSFLYGDNELMLQYKYEAWKTIILFLLSQYKLTRISADNLIRRMLENTNKWEGLGVTDRYRLFEKQELAVVRMVLEKLEKSGFLNKVNSDEYEVVIKNIDEWEQKVSASLIDGNIRSTTIFLDGRA